MPTANEALFDASVRHQIFLLRFGGASANKIVKLLDEADADLAQRLARRFERLGPLDRQQLGLGLATTQRLQRMLTDIRQQNRDLRVALRRQLRGDLRDLTEAEIDIATRRLNEAVGVDLNILRPSPELLVAAMDGPVIRGRTLRQWFKKLTDDRFVRLDAVVKLGVVEGDTTPQIIRRFREQAKVTKRSAEALVRTSVNAVGNQARELIWAANDDLITGLRWTATLDSRTSDICSARDGRVAPVGDNPLPAGSKPLNPPNARPPAHVACRSVMSAVLKTWEELAQPDALKRGRGASNIDTLFNRRLRERGLGKADIARTKASTRASMDGQVPGDLTYQEWLVRQPVGFQNEVLGRTKGALFRDGGLGLDKFVDMRTGRPFTIDELRSKEEAAFMKADIAA